MAIFRGNKIRGEQISDHSVQGSNILQGTLSDEHIGSGAAINESKLNINWHAHTEALQDRKVVDFVQVNGISASGTAITNLQAQIDGIVGIPQAGATNSIEGIITEYPKNLVPFRDSVTGEPISTTINSIEYEVIARMEWDTAASSYKVKFYTASGTAGAEVEFDMGVTARTIDMQYAQRFNLATINEMFAANEKFVAGAADVTAYMDIQQIAKDVYGSTWNLNRTGTNNLALSIQDQITQEKTRAGAAETALTNSLTSEIQNRATGDNQLQTEIDVLNSSDSVTGSVDYKIKTEVVDNLASDVVGKGAALVSIAPISGLSATTVQQALETLKTGTGDALITFKNDIGSGATGEGASLVGVDITKGLNGTNVEAVLENHEGRLDNLEADATVAGSVDYRIKTEVISPLASTASGKGANLVAVTVGDGLPAATVETVLVNHEGRVKAIENNITASEARVVSANNYFVAKTFTDLISHFADDEKVTDANFKRVDDRDSVDRTRQGASTNGFFAAGQSATIQARFGQVETEVDAKSKEITTARGSKQDINSRMSVAIRADGFLTDDNKIHMHKKYTTTLSVAASRVDMPAGEFFNINNLTGNGVVIRDAIQVYINGILQANGINFSEVADSGNAEQGVAINFGTEQLVAGDVVIFEYVVNNAN